MHLKCIKFEVNVVSMFTRNFHKAGQDMNTQTFEFTMFIFEVSFLLMRSSLGLILEIGEKFDLIDQTML